VSYILARRNLEPIEEAIEAQSRFASDASHELRTPLAAIQTENEVALRNPKLTLARAKDILTSNLEEVTRLQALSAGLLRLAREDGRDITLSPVALSEAVAQAISHYHKPAKQKHITVTNKVSGTVVHADQHSLTQALEILLDNAIKYSPVKTTVAITGGKRGKEGFVTVADEGPGISSKDLPLIFDRFYRADISRSSQRVSGHGLGLALAQKIVEQSGGAINAKSKLGKGAKFTISFPLAQRLPAYFVMVVTSGYEFSFADWPSTGHYLAWGDSAGTQRADPRRESDYSDNVGYPGCNWTGCYR
jgi:signal transduction histidine kinase